MAPKITVKAPKIPVIKNYTPYLDLTLYKRREGATPNYKTKKTPNAQDTKEKLTTQ